MSTTAIPSEAAAAAATSAAPAPSAPTVAAGTSAPKSQLDFLRSAPNDVKNFFAAAAARIAARLRGEPEPPASPAARIDVVASDTAAELVAKLPASMHYLLSHLPTVGSIGPNVGFAAPPVISSRELGESSATPAILEIPVAPQQQGPLAVGKAAYDLFFAGFPELFFNVNFSCAKAEGASCVSLYADPRSHWFNVFFGSYQIDAPMGAGKWSRPFGFAKPGSTQLATDDLQRIVNADWGCFSNLMYGVPKADIERLAAIQRSGPQPIFTVTNPAKRINGYDYVECTVDRLWLPSAYVSGQDGKKLTNFDPVFSPIWRKVFGRQPDDANQDPAVQKQFPASFPLTEMKGVFYLRTVQRSDPQKGNVYSTLIYGGGINKSWAGSDAARQQFNERFLQAQLSAVRATMPQATAG